MGANPFHDFCRQKAHSNPRDMILGKYSGGGKSIYHNAHTNPSGCDMRKYLPSAVAALMLVTHLSFTILTYWSAYGGREFLPDISPQNYGYWGFNWFQVLILLSAVFVIAAFTMSFRLCEVERPSSQVLRSLALALRADNPNTKMTGDKLVVRVGTWTTVEISAIGDGNRTTVSARAGATISGWVVVLILALVLSTFAIVALTVALIIFTRGHASANRRHVEIVTASHSDLPVSELIDLNKGIVDTLSEGRRIASEARRSVQLSYRLKILAILLIGMWILPAVIVLLARQALGGDSADLPENIYFYAILADLVIGIALIARVRNRMKPVIAEYRQWENRLDNLLSMDTSDKKDNIDESVIESLVEVAERTEKWTREQKRASASNDPMTWLLIIILLYVELGILSRIMLEFHLFRDSLGMNLVVLFVIEATLVFISYILISRARRIQARCLAYSDNDWKARKAWISSELEKRIEEVSHGR